MIKQLVSGELFRFTHEKSFRQNIIVLFLSALGCFGFLIFFEIVKAKIEGFSLLNINGVTDGIKSYNLGLIKIWDSDKNDLDSVESAFNAILPAGCIAMLIGMFAARYSNLYRNQTSIYLTARQIKTKEIVGSLILSEVIMTNTWVLIYEVSVLALSVFGCIFSSMKFSFSSQFVLWIVSVHINCTAFSLLISALSVVIRKTTGVVTMYISLVLAGSGCLDLIIMLLGLPTGFRDAWVLNNLMNLSVYNIEISSIFTMLLVAFITGIISISIIILEFTVNKKERYR